MASSSPTLAGSPGDCCFQGVKHTGVSTGKIVTIAGVPTYISESAKATEAKKIILFFSDVYGSLFLNNKLIQDYFAEQGFTVLGPDYFLGDTIDIHANEAGWDRSAWFTKSRKQADGVLPGWLKAVKDTYGQDAAYCAVGYCFGAPYAMEQASRSDVTASAFAHPASLDEDHFSKTIAPLFMSCAETDHTFPLAARRRAEDILVAAKSTYHIQVFSGVAHGFAVRGDPDIETQRWAKEESARGIITWFSRFSALKSGSHTHASHL